MKDRNLWCAMEFSEGTVLQSGGAACGIAGTGLGADRPDRSSMRALFVCFFHSDRVARFVRLAAPASVLFCIFFSTTVSARAAEDVRKVYAQWCASCHGERLEGGSGSNLLGQTWKHGATTQVWRG